MTFLINRWYLAGWSEELRDKPLGRKICGEDITFFRTESGVVRAVASRCPHRFAPLHFGAVVGENIRCRYHGLEFGPSGACVVNPDGTQPPNMAVKTYHASERKGAVYVWIGDKDPHRDLPDWFDVDQKYGGISRSHLEIGCHFQFLMDNLMDHAHATHLHELLRSEAMIKHPRPEIVEGEDVVFATVWAPNSPAIPFFEMLSGRNDAIVDQWVEAKWQPPSTVTITAGVTPAGRPREEGVTVKTIHVITPQTETSSHYFWINVRESRLDDEDLTEKIRAANYNIFLTEDKWMVEGQMETMAGQEFWSLRPVLLQQDRAVAIVRRRTEKLLKEQTEAA